LVIRELTIILVTTPIRQAMAKKVRANLVFVSSFMPINYQK
jgi:hypothetical protein